MQRDDDHQRAVRVASVALEELVLRGDRRGRSSRARSRSRSPKSRCHHRAVHPERVELRGPVPVEHVVVAEHREQLRCPDRAPRRTVRTRCAQALRDRRADTRGRRGARARRTDRDSPSARDRGAGRVEPAAGVTDVARDREACARRAAGEQRRNSRGRGPAFQCVRWETIWRGYRTTDDGRRRTDTTAPRTARTTGRSPARTVSARQSGPPLTTRRRSAACASW